MSEIKELSTLELQKKLRELGDELLQLQAEKALGGTPSNMGAYKATRRSIARIKSHLGNN